MEIIFTITLVVCLFSIYLWYKRKCYPPRSNFLNRFRRRFKSRDIIRERVTEEFINSLMNDPDANINIGLWYTEMELRERADIHRARLNKYGRSMMNGEMLFLGPKGGVYKITPEGKKKYV